MQRLLLILFFTLSFSFNYAQEDAATATVLTAGTANFACAPSLTTTTCLATSTTQNLGSSTSAQAPATGTMANDVWFAFAAPAEVVKIRVCNPTFDAAFEIWNNAGTVMIASQNGNANTGAAGKEVSCVSGLTYNTTYKVRVGRVSGSGAGTFQFNVEHNAVEVRSSYTPNPPGLPCYTPGSQIKRTNTCAVGVGSTRWKFVPVGGGPEIICIGTGDYNMGSCPGLCMAGDYMVYCEVQANDTECGNIWWGYSAGRLINMCDGACPTISAPLQNEVVCAFDAYAFSVQSLGVGFTYQFLFTTDNGATQFCSTPSLQGQAVMDNVENCFRFGKIYTMQVRAWYCAVEPIPAWCSPGVTFITCAMPLVKVEAGACCKWRNKNGGNISATGVLGIDQYQFRFTEVEPCTLQPIAPAFNTAWLNGPFVNPNAIASVLPGKTYNIQVRGRINPNNCAQCIGGSTSLAGQQVDWGPACFISFRTVGSPPPGTVLSCGCTPNMPELQEDNYADLEELRYTEGESETVGVLIASTTAQRIVAIDLSQSMLEGDGVLRVYNMSGQLMHQQSVMDVKINDYLTVDIAQRLVNGIYIISVTTDSGSITDKIFIGRE